MTTDRGFFAAAAARCWALAACALALCAAAAALPEPARGQAQIKTTLVDREGTTLIVSEAGGSLRQVITITMVDDLLERRIQVRATGDSSLALSPDADCDRIDNNTVVCDIAAKIEVSAGALDDVVTTPTGGVGAVDIPMEIDGGAGADTVRGGAAADVIRGGGGPDQLLGRGQSDKIDGGPGNDSLDGGAGDDELTGGAGADDIVGGGGIDVARYDEGGRATGVTVTVGTGQADDGSVNDRASLSLTSRRDDVDASVEGVVGTGFADVLTGTPTHAGRLLRGGGGNDVLTGGPGHETIVGGPGDDKLNGGAGNDRFVADPGRDAINGGPGVDTADYSDRGFAPGDGPVTVTVGDGLANDGGQPDSFGDAVGGDIEVVLGSLLDDKLVGGTGNETLDGGEGDDELVGGSGVDRFRGRLGADLLRAADGEIDAEIFCDDGEDIVESDAADPVGDDCEQTLLPPGDLFPETRITGGPAKKVVTRRSRAKVRFRFRSPGTPDARFECKLDRKRFRPCKSPQRLRLKPGRHVFRVRAVDGAGNADPTPAKRRLRVVRRR